MVASRPSLAAALDLERIEPWGHQYSTVALEDPERIPTFGELAMAGDDSARRWWSRPAPRGSSQVTPPTCRPPRTAAVPTRERV